MSEIGFEEARDDRINFDLQYAGIPINFLLRFMPYEYSRDGISIHDQLLNEVDPQPGGHILDVGCSNGETLRKLRTMIYPDVSLLGVDLDQELLSNSPNLDEAELVAGNASRLPFASGSIDTVLSLFMLYHMRSPGFGLAEFERVLKPDGQLIVATSGENNKFKHRSFEHQIAEFVGCEPPSRYAENFNREIAEDLVPQFFTIEKRFWQNTEMVFDEKSIYIYLYSLLSMKDDFRPIPRAHLWMAAIGEIVMPDIMRQIESEGEFTDTVDRVYYVATKKD